MERLTEREHGGDGIHVRWNDYVNAAYRLADYEDTGLEPEAVEAMKNAMIGKAIAEIKEFNGIPIDRLRELVQVAAGWPKVGDTVWTKISIWMDHYGRPDGSYPIKLIFNGKEEVSTFLPDIYPGKVIFIGVAEKRTCFHVQDTAGHIISFDFKDIGKTVFLTREEAEAAL